MNSKVHGVIVRALENYVDPDVKKVLNTKINKVAWDKVRNDLNLTENRIGEDAKTYLDIMVQGAIDEDNCKLRSDVEDPNAKACALGCVLASKTGPQQHWLEHFWNTKMEDDHKSDSKKTGFKFTHAYVADIVSELLGINYLQTYINLGGLQLGSISSNAIAVLAEGILSVSYGKPCFDQYYSAPHRAEKYWTKILQQYKNGEKERAFYNLGKICHLLADVGTPAHMHGDGHMGLKWINDLCDVLGIPVKGDIVRVDDDEYEEYTGKKIVDNLVGDKITADAIPEDWRMSKDKTAVYSESYSLFDYFRLLGEITRQYDSDDADGTKSIEPYHWEHFDLLNFDSYTHKLARNADDDLTEAACHEIASNLIPATIAHTIGVLYHFVVEAKIPCAPRKEFGFVAQSAHIYNDKDNAQGGELYFTLRANGQEKNLSRIKANSGDNIDLTKKEKTVINGITATTDNKIRIETSCIDNDDWTVFGKTVHKAHDSLGKTDVTYDVSGLKKVNDYILESNLRSSNKDYSITYKILLRNITDDTRDKVIQKLRNMKGRDLAAFKSHVLNCKTIPLYLNLTTGRIHTNNTKGARCGNSNRDSGKLVALQMFPSEINKMRNVSPVKSFDYLNKFVDKIESMLNNSTMASKLVEQLKTNGGVKGLQTVADVKTLCTDLKRVVKSTGFKSHMEKEAKNCTVVDKFSKKLSANKKELDNVLKLKNQSVFAAFKTDCSCCKDKNTSLIIKRELARFK